MNGFCPDCGNQLSVVKGLDRYWLTVLICPRCHDPGFLKVADAKWIYPLQRLEYGTLGKIMVADEATLDLAASRIKYLDYKTVSISQFEATLLGIYDERTDYKAVPRSRGS